MQFNRPRLKFNINRVRANARRFHLCAQKFWKRSEYDVFFAVKSNPAPEVLSILAQEDFGFEVMAHSQLNLTTGLSQRVIVSGFYKSPELIQSGLKKAKYLVIESPHEIQQLINTAAPAQLLLRLKLSPERKIGLSQRELLEIVEHVKTHPRIQILGLHFHTGWNVKDSESIRAATRLMRESYFLLIENGIRPQILNLGGSFCEPAVDPLQLEMRFKLYKQELGDLEVQFHFEPGRYLVGDAGDLVAQIVYIDEPKRVLHINTCAYSYSLTAGTPQVQLLDSCTQEEKSWTFYGFWPSEGDQCVIPLRGIPQKGSLIAFKNLGAYTWDMPMQFDPEFGLSTEFFEGPL